KDQFTQKTLLHWVSRLNWARQEHFARRPCNSVAATAPFARRTPGRYMLPSAVESVRPQRISAMMRSILVGIVVLMAAGIGWLTFDWYRSHYGGQPFGAPFTLVDQRGQPITEAAFRGHP